MSARPTLRGVGVFVASVAVCALTACKKTQADVRSMLEQEGYDRIEIDAADNDQGIFHFTAQKAFEDCRGTVMYRDQGLVSVTCSPRLDR